MLAGIVLHLAERHAHEHVHEPLVHEHAAWALGRLGSAVAAVALRERLAVEPDADVREEISSALRALDGLPDTISQ